MRLKTLVLLAVAVTCGLVAMLGVQQVLSGNSPAGKTNNVSVLVAKTEILAGTPLDERNVEFRDWPRDNVPEGAVVKKEQYEDRALKVRTFPGDIITETKLDKKGVRNASADVPKGKTIASVPIDPTMTGTGLVRPGDKVDVLVTYKPMIGRDAAGVGKEVKTVLECVTVFAVDGMRDASQMPAVNDPKATLMKNVSLAITLEQAKLLKLAGDIGQLHLTLRANDDEQRGDPKDLFDPTKAETIAVRKESERDKREPDFEPQVAAPVVEPVEKKKWKIEIFSGTVRRVEEVDLTDEEFKTQAGPADAVTTAPSWDTLKKLFGG